MNLANDFYLRVCAAEVEFADSRPEGLGLLCVAVVDFNYSSPYLRESDFLVGERVDDALQIKSNRMTAKIKI